MMLDHIDTQQETRPDDDCACGETYVLSIWGEASDIDTPSWARSVRVKHLVARLQTGEFSASAHVS